MEMTGIEEHFADTVMEAPHAFTAGGKHYCLYPLSLGKLMLVQRELRSIEINDAAIAQMPIFEVIRLVAKHREECLLIIAYVTAKSKSECFDARRIKETTREFSELSDEDIATLMVYILTHDKTEEVKRHYEIDKENEAMSAVLKVKSQGGSIAFGGKTILGAIIDQACERYGWTVEYVVWGISYTTLRLMMADRVNTIYLSDDERKKVPANILQRGEEVIKASKETMAQIKEMSWK